VLETVNDVFGGYLVYRTKQKAVSGGALVPRAEALPRASGAQALCGASYISTPFLQNTACTFSLFAFTHGQMLVERTNSTAGPLCSLVICLPASSVDRTTGRSVWLARCGLSLTPAVMCGHAPQATPMLGIIK